MEPKPMNTTRGIHSPGITVAAIAIVLSLVLGTAAPAFATSALVARPALVTTPTPLPNVAIPLKSIAGLTSLNATVQIDVNGLVDGKRTQGDLNAVLATNDQGKSKITATGSLLGVLAAQLGGSLGGLFRPSSVDLYKVPQGTYAVVNSWFPVCVKLDALEVTAALDELSPQSLLNMLTNSDVARGRLVGQETLHGVPVKHWVIDGDAFLAAARKSRDPKLRAFGAALRSAEDADLYVDAKGGYPLAFRGGYSGPYEPLKFEGDFDVQVELTGINTNTPVNLPASCNRPISP
jgi:hypothetical protein